MRWGARRQRASIRHQSILGWGSWNAPHVGDVPLRDIVDLILRVRVGGYSIEQANPRHEHEWRAWEDVRLPEGRLLHPGMISHETNVVEQPELVAEAGTRLARLVGRENIVASTDCGFAQGPFVRRVHPSIQWAKLEALVAGAALASSRLWRAAACSIRVSRSCSSRSRSARRRCATASTWCRTRPASAATSPAARRASGGRSPTRRLGRGVRRDRVDRPGVGPQPGPGANRPGASRRYSLPKNNGRPTLASMRTYLQSRVSPTGASRTTLHTALTAASVGASARM